MTLSDHQYLTGDTNAKLTTITVQLCIPRGTGAFIRSGIAGGLGLVHK